MCVQALVFLGCAKKSSNPVGTDTETGPPMIVSLTADKTQILFGGMDPATITCEATGGGLNYVWEVDLGDIVPVNTSHSKVTFSGAACCVGEKTIKCTVSNSLGSTSKTIVITILEVIEQPEIISLEVNKTRIQSSLNETASFVCYAIGGNLRYSWASDCGILSINTADSSKATLTAKAECVGTRNITCTVSNEKGKDTKTVQITIEN